MAECLDPGRILSLLQVLVSPDTSKQSTSTGSAIGPERFDQVLETNLTKFREELNKPALKALQEKMSQDAALLFGKSFRTTLRWDFVEQCLLILYTLQESMSEKMKVYMESSKIQAGLKPSQAPPLPPDTLGVGQQKAVLTALQFVIILAVSPNLQPGVGIPLERRSEFGRRVATSHQHLSHDQRMYQLFVVVKVLVLCLKSTSLGALILSRHLNDILAMLLQLLHGPSIVKINDSEINVKGEMTSVKNGVNDNKTTVNLKCMSNEDVGLNDSVSNVHSNTDNTSPILENAGILQSTPDSSKSGDGSISPADLDFSERSLADIFRQVHPPLLVRELLVLQGGTSTKSGHGSKPTLQRAPAWLRKACGKLLTDILVKPRGVLNVLQGMLGEISGGGGPSSSKGSDWRKCDAVAKVIACCPMQQSSLEDYYRQICPQILDLLNVQDKMAAREFLRVACSTITCMMTQSAALTRQFILDPLLEPLMRCTDVRELQPRDEGGVIVWDAELSQCIENIHKMFVIGMEPQSECFTCLLPVFHPLFHLYCFIREGVSHLRKVCFEILTTVLRQMDSTVCLALMEFVTVNTVSEEIRGKVHHLNSSVAFAAGEKGGVAVIVRESGSCNLSDVEAIVPAVVSLLKDLQKDGIAGDFLLSMLQVLTNIVSAEIQSTEVRISAQEPFMVSMETEKDRMTMVQDMQNKLIILQVLALMCEDIGPTCLKNTKQTLDFVKVTLERGIQVCEQTDDEMTGIFESETLTMAMGLLTSVLSGALKMTDREMEQMMGMLPLLDRISQNHHDPSVKEMTSDLRIAIATRGTVWSEKLAEAKDSIGKVVDSHNKETRKIQGKEQITRKKPLIEVISSQDVIEEEMSSTEEKVKVTVDEVQDISVQSNDTEVKKEEGVLDDKVKDKPPGDGNKTELEVAFEELCDPLLPVRGHALISLCRLVKEKDPETLAKQDTVLKVFLENVGHSDSYLYLASVNGLVAMADRFPDIVIPRLVEEFTCKADGGGTVGRRSAETMKIGECLVQTSKRLGDTSPMYRDSLLNAFLSGCHDDDDLVRASSLSNLGELCKVLRFSLGNNVQEVFSCCSGLLRSDRSPEVRKAACVTLTLLLRGLGQDMLKVLDTVLRDIYRLLKLVLTTERDPGVMTQAQLAYSEMEDIMREFLFPPQTLQKRIHVLDPQ